MATTDWIWHTPLAVIIFHFSLQQFAPDTHPKTLQQFHIGTHPPYAKAQKRSRPFEPTSDRKCEKWQKMVVKMGKCGKISPLPTMPQKQPTTHEKIYPITYIKNQTKRNRERIWPIAEHHKSKTDRQNATPNRKHRRRATKNATERTKTKTEYKNKRPQKENAPQRKKSPQGKTKAPAKLTDAF